MVNKKVFKVIGFGIFLWLAFQVDLSNVINILARSESAWLFAALSMMVAHTLLKFLRYHFILMEQGMKNSFMDTILYSLAAIYLSIITPGRIGEISKGFFLAKRYGAPLDKLLAGSMLDRLFDVYTLLLTAMLGFVFLIPGDDTFLPFLGCVGMALIPPTFLLPGSCRKLFVGLVLRFQKSILHNDSWSRIIWNFFNEVDSLLNWKLLWCIALSFLAYFIFFESCSMLNHSLGIVLPYQKIAVYVACANILSFLPITFAGIGTREACLIYFFNQNGLNSESALAFSMLFFCFTYIFFGILGFCCFMALNLDSKSWNKSNV
jgi:uncharacterized protein (TIRG00374 family)